MDQKIQRQFVEDRAAVLDFLPVTWNVKRPGPYYCLTMKMSRLKDLAFGFEFGSVNPRETFPVTGFPERIVKLDVSLNELEELQADSLLPFENLLELDVSLNALGSVHAVGALPSLAVLNASYNAMTHIKGLATCSHLITLNVSHNHVRSMKDLPMLASLNQLHLDSNELESLEGIQNLPQLYELYVQNNQISSLLPLSTSLSLNVLDASNNDLGSLPETLQVVCGLRRLTQLKLKGNSLARDSRYATAIKQNTTVQILDNSLLKDPTDIGLSPKQRSLLKDFLGSSPEGGPTRQGLKDVAQKSFMGKLQAKRKDVESAVHHLHGRIMDLREELKDYEDNLSGEMESYVRYIDVIPPEHFHSIDPQKVPQAMEKYLFTKFWERWEHGKRKPGNVPFKDLTKPEEVIQMLLDFTSSVTRLLAVTARRINTVLYGRTSLPLLIYTQVVTLLSQIPHAHLQTSLQVRSKEEVSVMVCSCI